jgi:hypothetical protein
MLTQQSNALPPYKNSARNLERTSKKIVNTAKNSKCFSKYSAKICLVIGTTVATFLCYGLSLSFVLFSLYLRLYLVVFFCFLSWGFPGI